MKKIYVLLLLATLITGSGFTTSDTVIGYSESQTRITRYYPNPASSYITFEFQKTIERGYTLQVYNFMGKKVEQIALSNSRVTVSLENYFRGVYIFQLSDKSGKIIDSGKFQVVK